VKLPQNGVDTLTGMDNRQGLSGQDVYKTRYCTGSVSEEERWNYFEEEAGGEAVS